MSPREKGVKRRVIVAVADMEIQNTFPNLYNQQQSCSIINTTTVNTIKNHKLFYGIFIKREGRKIGMYLKSKFYEKSEKTDIRMQVYLCDIMINILYWFTPQRGVELWKLILWLEQSEFYKEGL